MSKTSRKSSAVLGRERPLSPHLQIYKPQISSVLSITHRFSGIGLFMLQFLLAGWLWVGAFEPELFEQVNGFLASPLGLAGLVAAVFVLIYNLLHGIRHYLWDRGVGFEIATVCKTAWLIIFGSILITAGYFYWVLTCCGN